VSDIAAPFRRFGPYAVLQLSGAGGMGRVDVVVSTRLGGFTKVCVLKRMLPELRTPEQEARFRREASIALRMSHGAIAQTLDVVEIEGEICLLQELVHGTTLAHLERRAEGARERLPVPLVVHVTSEIARALAYAHSFEGGGVIHRDVTPDNIMLSFSGEAKLVDFGIARSVIEQPLTEVGMVVGRPLYTAPEVLAGGEADARSDVYSLGVVLWQALSGATFPGAPAGASAKAATAPSTFSPAVPAALDAIALRAVSSRPEDRFEHAEELQSALMAVLPQGYVADRALAAFLARHFNVDRERRQLAEDIARASEFLASTGERPSAQGSTILASEAARPNARYAVLLTTAALSIAGGVVLGLRLAPGSAAPHHGAAPDPVALVRPSATPPPAPIRDPLVAEAPAADHTLVTRHVGRPSDRPSATRDNAALLRDAERSFKSGDLSSALVLARRAAREGAGGEAHLIMGKIFYAQDRLAEAEAEFERARKANPGDGEAVRYLDLVRQDLSRPAR
jgi:hypothetical protein